MIKITAKITLAVFETFVNIETDPETNSFMAHVYHLQ